MDVSLGKISVGTSGYSYEEWLNDFYPANTPAQQMLPYYARTFSLTELNYTWYAMPRADAIERMLKHVNPDFKFAAKLTRTMTHEIDPKQWRNQVNRYREGIAPLIMSRQLAAILIQFPQSFNRSDDNRRYLAALLDQLHDLPLAVEFRNASWAVDKVFDGLAQRKVTLVAVDEPDLPGLFPPLDVVTNPEFFYVRFHGRNADGWRSGKMQNQFDFNYSDAELSEWVDTRIMTMADQAKAGYILFNNHVRGQAPRNAQSMVRVLRQAGLG
jgi:uncharacterized protein YecE (DUF72 family)